MLTALSPLTTDHLDALTPTELEGLPVNLYFLETLTEGELAVMTAGELERLSLLTRHTDYGRGVYRIADLTELDHRVYAAADASPDLTAAPYESWSALGLDTLREDQLESLTPDLLGGLESDDTPVGHTVGLLGVSYLSEADLDALTATELAYLEAGGATWHIVRTLRNEWGLESQNLGGMDEDEPDAELLVIIGDDGTLQSTPPSDPDTYAIAADASGAFRITASYAYGPDGANKANRWAIYFTSTGTDPNPTIDSPTYITMVQTTGVSVLDYPTSTFAAGTTGKVIVRTDRSGVESTNTTVESATASTTGPAATDMQGNLGTIGVT